MSFFESLPDPAAPLDVARDEAFMQLALEQARLCLEHDDVPVGAVLVRGDDVLAVGHNERELRKDPTAHAEVLALRSGSANLKSWRLDGAELFVTLEPCFMCAGALVLSRLPRLVFGTLDPKAGAAGSLANVCHDPRLNHRLEVTSGPLEKECGDLLREFFAAKRRQIR